MLTLQLLISTIDGGIANVPHMLLAPTEGVGYVVTWQMTGGTRFDQCPQQLLMRSDVKLLTMHQRGLSRSRNHCIDHASADVCLVCDDDCRYTAAELRKVVEAFECDPELDMATFQMTVAGKQPGKAYPQKATVLKPRLPKGYYLTSMELAFRLSAFKAHGLRFDEELGLGSPMLWCGEEELLLHQAITAGMKCEFFPTVIVDTATPTTGSARATLPQVIMGRGAFLGIVHPHTRHLRALKIALTLHRQHGVPILATLRHMLAGMAYHRRATNSRKQC